MARSNVELIFTSWLRRLGAARSVQNGYAMTEHAYERLSRNISFPEACSNGERSDEQTLRRCPAAVEWLLRRHRSAVILLSMALAAYHAFAILAFGLTRIDGHWYGLPEDDVMISLRYARNLAAGNGLVLNVGERVEGFTNPLLTFLCAGLHLVSIPPPLIPLALDVINLGLSLCILWMLLRFWGERPEGMLAGLVAGSLYVLAPQHLYFAAAGFEVYLQAAILLYCVWRIERGSWGWAFLLGLLPLTHGTSQVAWLVLCAALLLIRRAAWSLRLALLLVAVAPVAIYEIFRIAYYGDVFPNTYYLKVGPYPISKGPLYVAVWAATALPLFVLGAHPVFLVARSALRLAITNVQALGRAPSAATPSEASGRSMTAVTILVAHVTAVAAIGGDYFPQSRFLFPCSALLAVMAGRGGVLLLEAARRSGRSRAIPVTCAILVVIAALGEPCVNYLQFRREFDEHRQFNIQNVTVGLALKNNTPPDSVVGLMVLGAIGYYSERPVIDMLGKADRHIARTKPHRQRQIAHNKSDFTYALKRSPDFVEMRRTREELADIPRLTDRSLHHPHGWMDELALHPVFRAAYLPYHVHDTEGRPLPVYARSPAGITGWHVPEEYFAATSKP